MLSMNTELEPGYYYWKLTAYQSSTDSKLFKYVMIPAILGKMNGLKHAMIDFQKSLGREDDWKVTHQALSEKYYVMRLAALAKEEAIWKRKLG